MKKLFLTVLFSVLIVSLAQAQLAKALVVTSEDVQIRFMEDPTEQWRPVELISAVYSVEPVGTHKPMVKLGHQIWEGLVDKDKPELGKAIMVINITALPAPNWRGVEFHFRVRENTVDPFISEFSESHDVRIFGNPGKPNQVK